MQGIGKQCRQGQAPAFHSLPFVACTAQRIQLRGAYRRQRKRRHAGQTVAQRRCLSGVSGRTGMGHGKMLFLHPSMAHPHPSRPLYAPLR